MPRLGKNTLLSFWEHKNWCQGRDIIVVGAGFVGLSAALESRRCFPDASITIVELSPFSGGGSTKNAGFVCFGSPSELLDDWNTLGPEKTIELVASRYNGIKNLRSNFSEEEIGYEPTGAIELFTDEVCELKERTIEFLPTINGALEEVFGSKPFEVKSYKNGVLGANDVISSPLEGILDTSKLYRATLSKALYEGIDIINGCKIQNIERDGEGFRLDFDFGFFEAKEVMIAANAFAKDLIPNLDVQPSVNRVLVTEEIPGLKFNGSCHYDRGYVYLRRIGNRMLIGGGRQWGDGDSKEVENKLKSFLYKHIEGTSDAQVEYNWIGHLGVGASRDPIVKTIEPGLHVGVRMGGMGVAIGGIIGRELGGLPQL